MTIERIYKPSKQVLESYILKGQPFIATGIVNEWNAYKMWSSNHDYLVKKLGDKEVPIREIGFNVGEWLGKTTTLKFSQFWKLWYKHFNSPDNGANETPQFYLASLPVHKYFKEIESDYNTPDIPKEQGKSANLWIGFKGQVTPLHHDWSSGDPGMDGLHAVVCGRKLFKLYDPSLNLKCFKRKSEWGLFHHAAVDDIENPNFDLFPEVKNAVGIDAVIEQGEMLFIPKLWWHHVRTLEPSISLNFWFQDLGSEFLKCYRYLGVMEHYLEAVYNMQVPPSKLKTLIQFFDPSKGQNISDEVVEEFKKNPIQFVSLPKFISSFSNAINKPIFKNYPNKERFRKKMTKKI